MPLAFLTPSRLTPESCAEGSLLPELLLAAALDVAGGRAQGMTAALLFESVLAALHMAFGALLDLLNVVAGVVHVLLTECADHKRGLQIFRCADQANVEAESVFPRSLDHERFGAPTALILRGWLIKMWRLYSLPLVGRVSAKRRVGV
jgi:hypothetical protein